MLTKSKLDKLLSYNPETDEWIWKVDRYRYKCKDKKAGYTKNNGRLYICIDNKEYPAYHLVWLYMTGSLPSNHIDHIDGNFLNNRLYNLREVNNQQNHCNSKIHKDNTSGYKGVTWNSRLRKWRTQIRSKEKRIHVGLYTDILDAAKAYNEAALLYHGEFARLNTIGG